jgi:hypothetical protein
MGVGRVTAIQADGMVRRRRSAQELGVDCLGWRRERRIMRRLDRRSYTDDRMN